MSRSKLTKHGKSHYLESWNPSAKRFVVTCIACGRRGFKPEVADPAFASTLERQEIQEELKRVLEPMELDTSGCCTTCKQLR